MRSAPIPIAMALLLLACGAEQPESDEPEGPKKPFTLVAFEKTKISSLQDAENFQKARKAIDWGKGPFERATLVVDLESPCVPFSRWREPGVVPPGHNFPADCDAFDRTFTFHLLPQKEGEPAVELVRAITPFGGPMHFEVDLTDYANGLPGPREIEVRIGTWPDHEGQVTGSRGSWLVSARLEMVPGKPPREILAVVPLFNEDWRGPQENARFSYSFEVPEGTRYSRIDYRATGHGGGPQLGVCVGPSDEFCTRTHEVLVGGAPIFSELVWRTCEDNCDLVEDPAISRSYCAQNPTGHPESAVAPRANWCPGHLTPPFVIGHAKLNEPGPVTVDFGVDLIGEGGSWTVSATYVAYR